MILGSPIHDEPKPKSLFMRFVNSILEELDFGAAGGQKARSGTTRRRSVRTHRRKSHVYPHPAPGDSD